jgi:hypothetical protein
MQPEEKEKQYQGLVEGLGRQFQGRNTQGIETSGSLGDEAETNEQGDRC